MELSWITRCLIVLLLLSAGAFPVLSASQKNGTISIAYRGSGGNYIGDSIVFDGVNTLGNTTAIRITGPGLPAEGVPPYNLDGELGSGNSVPVDTRNIWIFSWDMSRIDSANLKTARYIFTAWDTGHSEITATTSLVLKRPEFYLVAQPTAGRIGDYIEFEGMAERGVSYIRLDMKAQDGAVVHTFFTPVSALGFFQHGFRLDMAPGQYTVTGSNPSMKRDLTVIVTVRPPDSPVPAQPAPTGTDTAIPTGAVSGAPAPAGSGGQQTPAATQAGSSAAVVAIAIGVLGTAAFLYGRK